MKLSVTGIMQQRSLERDMERLGLHTIKRISVYYMYFTTCTENTEKGHKGHGAVIASILCGTEKHGKRRKILSLYGDKKIGEIPIPLFFLGKPITQK